MRVPVKRANSRLVLYPGNNYVNENLSTECNRSRVRVRVQPMENKPLSEGFVKTLTTRGSRILRNSRCGAHHQPSVRTKDKPYRWIESPKW